MAQFIAFKKSVEVLSKPIYAFIKSFPVGEEKRLEILKKYGINPDKVDWVLQKKWLNALKELFEIGGNQMLEKVGEAIPEHAEFPPHITNLRMALMSINIAYQMNHRGGEIGYYDLIEFDESNRQAIMKSNNPYPDSFDLGLIKGMTKKFLPKDSFQYNVEIDLTQNSRTNGSDSTFYIINW